MLQTMVVSYCLSVFCPFPISNELLNLKFFILLFLYMFYFPCSISYHWAPIFPILIRKTLPSNSVIADGELPLIDVAVEASAADIQLEADRCNIVCADFVVLERALGNSVFHGSGIFQLQECRFGVSAAHHPCCRTPTIPVPMQVSFQPILFSYNPLSVRPVPM